LSLRPTLPNARNTAAGTNVNFNTHFFLRQEEKRAKVAKVEALGRVHGATLAAGSALSTEAENAAKKR